MFMDKHKRESCYNNINELQSLKMLLQKIQVRVAFSENQSDNSFAEDPRENEKQSYNTFAEKTQVRLFLQII